MKDDKIVIVDEFTGRAMDGRRWSDGLHQAIEAKEGVKIKPESVTLATITYQNFFRMYEKLSGLTGPEPLVVRLGFVPHRTVAGVGLSHELR